MEKNTKNQIKKEIMEKINKLLENENEQYRIDNISILNNKDFTGFMGSIRIYKKENLEKIRKKLEEIINKYGEAAVNQRHIVPCCELPYHYLTFNIKAYENQNSQ